MSDREQDMARVRAACDTLAEHFDSVQVFVTRHEAGTEDGTVNINLGAGNWFTRFGQVKDWCVRSDENTRIGCMKPDDGE